jgi:hypothetical protein
MDAAYVGVVCAGMRIEVAHIFVRLYGGRNALCGFITHVITVSESCVQTWYYFTYRQDVWYIKALNLDWY